MVAKKTKSKRQTLAKKYKIIKRVKEHHKRLKKGINLSSGKKAKDENRIPNEWPHKAQLLNEIQVAKEKLEESKQKQKEKRAETIVTTDFPMILFFNAACRCKRDYQEVALVVWM